MAGSSTLLIGVDGGATEVKAHAVQCGDMRRVCDFSLRQEAAFRRYPLAKGFEPLPLEDQFAQREAHDIRPGTEEVEQGRYWVAAAAEAICEVAQQAGERRLLIGIGMPGLKTPDGRGIEVIHHGPRIPDYLAQLERLLRESGLELRAPIAALGSDADYCGLGEECAAKGLFRDVEHAYYLGGGTGIADALKLNGRLISFNQTKSWIQKSWQMVSTWGNTYENLVSARALNEIYGRLTAASAGNRATGDVKSTECGDESNYPEHAASAGEPVARGWLGAAAMILAELIFERMWTIKNGRRRAAWRGPAYAALAEQHAHRGTVLQRVVIGQRIGLIYNDPDNRLNFGVKLESCLAGLIAAAGDSKMIAAYLEPTSSDKPSRPVLKSEVLRASRLRAAPALGAAVAALRAFPSM